MPSFCLITLKLISNPVYIPVATQLKGPAMFAGRFGQSRRKMPVNFNVTTITRFESTSNSTFVSIAVVVISLNCDQRSEWRTQICVASFSGVAERVPTDASSRAVEIEVSKTRRRSVVQTPLSGITNSQ